MDTDAMSAPRWVLLVNPNSNRSTTATMASFARERLAPRAIEVVEATAAAGPPMITNEAELQKSGEHVTSAVTRALAEWADPPIAVIVAAIGDPGRDALERTLDVPVFGLGQASVLAGSADGRGFGMATTTPDLAESLTALAHRHADPELFTGVRVTRTAPLVLARDPEKQFEELVSAVSACVGDGAQRVIIAGGPLSDTARRIQQMGMAEIVEPIPAACQLVIGLST